MIGIAIHHHGLSMLILRNVRPLVMSSSPSVRITNPVVSSLRPGSGFDSGTPNRIAKNTRVTATAGAMSVSVTLPAERAEQPARRRARR